MAAQKSPLLDFQETGLMKTMTANQLELLSLLCIERPEANPAFGHGNQTAIVARFRNRPIRACLLMICRAHCCMALRVIGFEDICTGMTVPRRACGNHFPEAMRLKRVFETLFRAPNMAQV